MLVCEGQPKATSPPTPSRCPHGATLLPCATVRCYCSATMPHDVPTTPKVASAVNVPPHAQSSHSSEGMALALLDQDEVLEDDFQTQHMLVRCVRWWGDSGSGSLAGGGLECAGGSLGQWVTYCLDIGEEEETLETVDPTWRTTRWLQLAVQGISDDEVPWYECIAPLMLEAEGTALSLAKCLLTIWRWSLRVQGWDICPPTPTILNIGQFMTQDEVQGEVDNLLWFEVYSHALQRVGEAICDRRWQWPEGKAQEVAVSPIVRAFWEETGVEPAATCTRLCWELQPRAVFRRRERGAVSHAITFLDYMTVRVPTLNAWDQFVWLPSAAIPWTTMQVEQYGYCHGNAADLGTVMTATEFRVTDEEGTYLCTACGLIFEGSVLAYDHARDEVEWVPAHRVTNDLSWVEERMAVTFANFVPHTPKRQTALQTSGPTTSWPGPMTPPQRERVSRCRRRVMSPRRMSVRK